MAAITEDEKLRRQRIVESVIGSSEMEGLTPDASSLELMRRFVEGELAMDEFAAAMDRHANELLSAHRDLAGAA